MDENQTPPLPPGSIPVAVTRRLRSQARLAAARAARGGGLRVLWTGSRAWEGSSERIMTMRAVMTPVAQGIIDGVPDRQIGFMHGAARGVDDFVDELLGTKEFALVVPEVYPPMPGEHPLDRNRRMIENKPGMVIGLPHRAAQTGGTWHTLRLAYGAKIPAYVLREILGLGWRLDSFVPRGGSGQEGVLW